MVSYRGRSSVFSHIAVTYPTLLLAVLSAALQSASAHKESEPCLSSGISACTSWVAYLQHFFDGLQYYTLLGRQLLHILQQDRSMAGAVPVTHGPSQQPG